MEKKFTQGPWRYVRGNGSATTGQHMIAGAKPGYLAEVRDCGSGDVAANAHLIAAAPEMFEALQALLMRCDEFVNPHWQECIDAHAAINKALGKS